MKRISLLFLGFLTVFYFFRPAEEKVNETDIVQIKLSATKRLPSNSAPKKLAPPPATKPVVVTKSDDSVASRIEDEARVSEVPENDYAYNDEDQLTHEDDVPWEEISTAWRSHLRDLLSELDPESGESIYAAYEAEKSAFRAEMEALAPSKSQDADMILGQLEVRHEEKLKEILGQYYSEITDHHQQFIRSIQYLNRSPNGHQIGVAL